MWSDLDNTKDFELHLEDWINKTVAFFDSLCKSKILNIFLVSYHGVSDGDWLWLISVQYSINQKIPGIEFRSHFYLEK